jgi:hypothetical protein
LSSTAPAARPKKSRLLGLLRNVFAVVLLAAVAYFVPWRDRLTLATAQGSYTLAGDIVGDWRESSIHFRIDREESVAPEWPEDVRQAHADQAPLLVVRTESATLPRLDWRPGMLRVFNGMKPWGLIQALALLIVAALIAVRRWQGLLEVAGCPTSYGNAFRLSFLGLFFNLVVPGLTGGDVVKAVLVVREHPERRADALVSVIVDRGLGLLVLIGLAVIVTWWPGSRFSEVRLGVLLTFVGILLVLWVFLAPLPRRVLKIDRVLARLPQKERVKKMDAAVRWYGAHPGQLALATLLSVLNHCAIALSLFALGRAFGDQQLDYPEYLGVAAIANTISSIPIAPGGWGVGEAAYASLFHMLGAPATLGIAVSVTFRLLSMGMGLVGGLFLLLPSGRKMREEIHDAESRRDE